MRDTNKFNENAYTGEDINELPIEAGNIYVDLNHENKPKNDLPFDFYNALVPAYADINSNTRIELNKVFVIFGKPEKEVKTPDSNRVYYDIKNRKYYTYNNSQFTEITQDKEFIPFRLFY